MIKLTSCLLPLLAASIVAQNVTVDVHDSTLGAVAGQYPIYTSTTLNVIRGQSWCPPTFAGLPTTPMICTRVGFQIANSAAYAKFEIRAGMSPVATLTNTYATNLPDQRLQVDLSGTMLTGGTGANVWVDYPIKYPFYYKPGNGLILDLTTQAQTAGVYCSTALGTGVGRVINTNWTGQTTGTLGATSGGIKIRFVFQPPAIVGYGTGCPGSASLVPAIASTGASSVGSFNYAIGLANALGGSPAVFTLGNPSELVVGGGCKIYNDLLVTLPLTTSGSGAGAGTASLPILIPNNPALVGTVVDTQYGIFDLASPALLPISLTPSGKVVIY